MHSSPWFWTGAWDVPPTHPLGILNWSVSVTTTGGKTATFDDTTGFAVGATEAEKMSNHVRVVP